MNIEKCDIVTTGIRIELTDAEATDLYFALSCLGDDICNASEQLFDKLHDLLGMSEAHAEPREPDTVADWRIRMERRGWEWREKEPCRSGGQWVASYVKMIGPNTYMVYWGHNAWQARIREVDRYRDFGDHPSPLLAADACEKHAEEQNGVYSREIRADELDVKPGETVSLGVDEKRLKTKQLQWWDSNGRSRTLAPNGVLYEAFYDGTCGKKAVGGQYRVIDADDSINRASAKLACQRDYEASQKGSE